MIIQSLPPIVDGESSILILGSMPGRESLRKRQYYAHPRNLFWPIMGSILCFDPAGSYETRTKLLLEARIALWDVVACCFRPGSMDKEIKLAVPQDFNQFFRRHSRIGRVCFNGTKAADIFQRDVLPTLSGIGRKIDFLRLPSTSPAYASLGLVAKREAWTRAVSLPLFQDHPEFKAFASF